MKRKRLLGVVLLVTFVLGLLPGLRSNSMTAFGADVDALQTVPLTGYELVRNGGFNYNLLWWSKRGAGSNNAQVEATADAQGGPAVRIFSESDANFATASAIYQELYLPDTITKATVSFKVKVAQAFEGQPPVQGDLINGWWAIAPLDANNTPDLANSVVFGAVFAEDQAAFTDWQTYAVEIPSQFITALNTARANKQRLAFILGTLSNSFRFSLLADDITIQVDGSRTHPTFAGEIAYIWDGKIQRISPNGVNPQPQTVWTHPNESYGLFNVRWNPTATELAFTSDHESPFSPFSADVYGIRMDGTGLRRITNAPSHADMQASGLGRGSVRVSVTNNYDTFTDPISFFRVYIQGAAEWGILTLPSQFGTTEVTIPNVVDLGQNTLQHVVFLYASSACGAVRRYVPGFVDVVAGQTVSVDLVFDGTGCGLSGVREATHLSWKRDGSEIGFNMMGAGFKVPVEGSSGPGAPWWPADGFMDHPAWSPVNNQVLYKLGLTTALGIHRIDPDSQQSGAPIVPPQQSGDPSYPAWLPDGSGFLYVENGNLFYSSIQGANIRQLTFFVNEFVHQPSVSPDGNYVVFERQSGDFKLLWLMEWDNPKAASPTGAASIPAFPATRRPRRRRRQAARLPARLYRRNSLPIVSTCPRSRGNTCVITFPEASEPPGRSSTRSVESIMRRQLSLPISSLRLPLLLLGGWLLMFWSALAVSAAPAATNRYVAPTGADSGACISIAAPCATIQYALDQAADGDVIVIAAGIYTENLQIAKSVTLHGADAATTVVDGSAQPRRVIAANFSPPLAITIRNLSIRNGKGGVIGSSGPLRVESSRIYHNDATGEFYADGGGVYAFGPLTVHNTAIYSNRGQYGGGIEARGLMTITASALYSNVAEYRGAINYGVIGSGSHYIENSTISHNVANSGGTVGSTSAHNALLLRHVTIAANRTLSSSIAGILSASTITVTLDHTIIANNVSDFASPQQCVGAGVISLGNNIASDDTCNLTAAGDQPTTNPQLGPLQDNGGSTWTHAIGSGSPALDAGDNSRCLATDQRGRVRPFDGDGDSVAVCDIGAYEFGAGDAPPPPQTDRYVAPSGADANNDCANPAAPCATIQHAIDQALTSGETVNIAAGT